MKNRQTRREERHNGSDKTRYLMREKLVSIADDFWIETTKGQKAFRVNVKILSVRKTLRFKDTQGNVLVQIQERVLRVKDSMEVKDANGKQLAVVKKALISPLRDRFTVQIKNGPDLKATGNMLDHKYKIYEGRKKVAEVSKKWLTIRDTYVVEIEPGQQDIVILAVTVCIDQMARK
jgi:uncharacterized protein YxjI